MAFAAAASAQVVSDPRIAEFDPSPDHWATLDGGQPAVVRYELGMYMVGASAPFTTVDMGKPSPDADGKIRYDFSSGVTGWPLPGGNYEARVSAVGPEGAALSDPSNPFTFTSGSSCTVTLGATTSRVPASGGAYTVDVSTGTGCAWTVTSSLSWVTLWSAGGSGSGTAPFEVAGQLVDVEPHWHRDDWRADSDALAGWRGGAAAQDDADGVLGGACGHHAGHGTQRDATERQRQRGWHVRLQPCGWHRARGRHHTLTASFTPADTTRYNTATASTVLVVNARRRRRRSPGRRLRPSRRARRSARRN